VQVSARERERAHVRVCMCVREHACTSTRERASARESLQEQVREKFSRACSKRDRETTGTKFSRALQISLSYFLVFTNCLAPRDINVYVTNSWMQESRSHTLSYSLVLTNCLAPRDIVVYIILTNSLVPRVPRAPRAPRARESRRKSERRRGYKRAGVREIRSARESLVCFTIDFSLSLTHKQTHTHTRTYAYTCTPTASNLAAAAW